MLKVHTGHAHATLLLALSLMPRTKRSGTAAQTAPSERICTRACEEPRRESSRAGSHRPFQAPTCDGEHAATSQNSMSIFEKLFKKKAPNIINLTIIKNYGVTPT